MNATATAAPETTLKLTRLIPASRERVYALWTDVNRAKEWWGPEGCETRELICDARPGGEFRWALTGPDGQEMTAIGEFNEVQPGKKVSYTWQWADDPEWADHESLVTVEFVAKNPVATELRLTHENLPSQQSRDNHIAGWSGALDKLEALLRK